MISEKQQNKRRARIVVLMKRIQESEFKLAQMEKDISWARQNIKLDKAELGRLLTEEKAENEK